MKKNRIKSALTGCAMAFAFAASPAFTAPAKAEVPARPDAHSHELYTKRTVRLSGQINLESSLKVRKELRLLDDIDPEHKDITLIIDSGGGYIVSGLAIIDRINSLKSKVNTVCEGQAKSMAAVVLASGTGTRSSLENCSIMIHHASSKAEGIVPNMQNALAETDRLNRKMIEILSKTTGIAQDDLGRAMMMDFNIMPAEAVKMGLIDHVEAPVNKREEKITRSIPQKALEKSFPR